MNRTRRASFVLAAAALCACTATFRHPEDGPALRPAPADRPRPALRLEVADTELDFQYLCFSGGRLPGAFDEAKPVSQSHFERHRQAWEETDLFARVERERAEPARDGLAVKVRIVRDVEDSDPTNRRALLTLGLWPLLFGIHEDRLVSLDAAFRRDGEFLGEITRAERVTWHRHFLLLPLAPFFGERDAMRGAERDLVHAVVAEAQQRGYL